MVGYLFREGGIFCNPTLVAPCLLFVILSVYFVVLLLY